MLGGEEEEEEEEMYAVCSSARRYRSRRTTIAELRREEVSLRLEATERNEGSGEGRGRAVCW